MRLRPFISYAAGFLIAVSSVNGATRYVDLNSANPIPPYLSWMAAATNIQDAIDVSSPGDLVLVTNGVYATGGRPFPGWASTNRVNIHTPITVTSFNGPSVTIIEGYRIPGDRGNTNSIRCVAITNGASLFGFTLRNGDGAKDGVGGGVTGVTSPLISGTVVSNCVISGNSAFWAGGGAHACTLYDCVITDNSAGTWGGGVERCIVRNSIISSNWVGGQGGGASRSALVSSSIEGNIAVTNGGGGLSECTASQSLIRWNRASHGGGVQGGGDGCRLTDCIIAENRALSAFGGGVVDSCFMTNCLVVSNSAPHGGGVTHGGTLVNCTVVGNTALYTGGISTPEAVYNTIIYFNHASVTNDNVDSTAHLWNGCTPVGLGVNIITNEPMFVNPAAGDFRLQPNSPCINAGLNRSTSISTALDGSPRITGETVDIGTYEFQTPTTLLSYAWATQYGIPTDGSADGDDPDGDGHNNWQEWMADTNPTNVLSVFRMRSITNVPSGINVTWYTVPTRRYWLERQSSDITSPAFQTILTNINGVINYFSYTDFDAAPAYQHFYRVGVHP